MAKKTRRHPIAPRGARRHGYEDIDEIDTTFQPFNSCDRVWIQRARKVLRKMQGWATIAFVCDNRYPNKTWHRMVVIRRYRRVYGRWKETSSINIHATDFEKISDLIESVDDVEVGEPDAMTAARQTGTFD